ncbi:glycosyltransferase [Anaerocolumna aminovalerica]|uniref:glycosyltransferase n=1 Tax=Anaerocolumna aminovalerica TaxID=1527 RepID=UPI00248B989A|nr:glycosyltransferase [Anaerocolumna aminovalerica]
MKILIHTYETAYQNKAGGVHNRIERTVLALKSNGIEVEFFDKYKTNITDFNLLHVFKLDLSSKALIDYAVSMGVKVVVSSIMTIEKGWLVTFYWKIRHLPFATLYKQVFTICKKVDGMIVETPREAQFMKRYYHLDDDKLAIIPNGAESISNSTDLIFDRLKCRCDYAIIVARFDENKNQLNVIKALKSTNINVVFVGGPDSTSREYYDKCILEAKNCNNFHFLGWLNSEDRLLKSALGNAKVLVCPSYHETFGLSIIEGIMAGATPVISNKLPILDFELLSDCLTFNPNNLDDIRKQIKKAMDMKRNQDFISKIEAYFSWDSIARQHIEFYKSVINNKENS